MSNWFEKLDPKVGAAEAVNSALDQLQARVPKLMALLRGEPITIQIGVNDGADTTIRIKIA